MSEWKKVKLGEISQTIQTGPFGSQLHQSDYSVIGIPVVMPKDIIAGNIEEASIARVEQHHIDRLSRHMISYGDILYARRGDVGKCAFTKQNQEGWLCGTGCLRVTINPDMANPKFVFFQLQKQETIGWITNHAIGSTMLNLNTTILSNAPVEIPSLRIQNRIVEILSRYDSLIENYQKQIKLLEEAAQRLYKEWFVDLRFPGHENTKIVDGLPEGWEKKKLCEFTGITDGTHDSPKQVEIGLPLVTGRCIVDGSIDFSQAYNISEEDVIKINKRSAVEDGDILLSNIGTIGKVCRISKSGNYAVKNMIIFKPHDAIHSCFLHRFLTDNNTQMDFLQQAAGTSQKFVSLSFIRNTLILRPSDTILNLFYNHSEKYFNYVQTLQSQLRLLTEARDRLLPKLMSGEIEI